MSAPADESSEWIDEEEQEDDEDEGPTLYWRAPLGSGTGAAIRPTVARGSGGAGLAQLYMGMMEGDDDEDEDEDGDYVEGEEDDEEEEGGEDEDDDESMQEGTIRVPRTRGVRQAGPEQGEDDDEEEDDDDEEEDDDEEGGGSAITGIQDLLHRLANPSSTSPTGAAGGSSTNQAAAGSSLMDREFQIPEASLRALFGSGALSADVLRRLGFVLTRAGGDDEEEDEEVDDEDVDMDDLDDEEDYLQNLFRAGGRPPSGYRSAVASNGRSRGWEWFPIEYEGKPAGRALARSGEFGRAGYPSAQELTKKRRRRASSSSSRRSFSAAGWDDELKPLSTSPTAGMGASAVTPGGSVARRSSYGFSGMPGGSAPLSASPSASLATSPGRGLKSPPSAKARRLTGSSVANSVTQREDKIRGIQQACKGKGIWAAGQHGWRRDYGRGVWGSSGREEWNRHCLPNSNGTIVATYDASPYIGQHSHDSSFFYTATQDFNLHLYSTQDAPKVKTERTTRSGRVAQSRFGRRFVEYDDTAEDSSLREIKTVQGVHGNWTVTDADLSRDNEWMVYSSINPQVHIFRTAEHEDEHQQLDFSERGDSQRFSGYWGAGHFGIWSVRLSSDAKEIVAGCGSGQIMVYDIERKKRVLCIAAHRDDVNGVCFADDSTNILVSASDDGYLKVWDRRSLASETPSGVLAGHTEGITYVSPRGDGRFCISNGKDQTMRLWDLRKMLSHKDITRDPDAASSYGLSTQGWDYRTSTYRKPRFMAHPKDCSVMQYRGHRVTKTLIRCHFSPVATTGGQYLYTGGSNGVIYIYALDGRIVQVLDRSRATALKQPDGSYNDPSAPIETPKEIPDPAMPGSFQTVVRDVSWSVDTPSMISTAWEYNDYSRGGNVAVHEWKGLGKGGLNRLEDWVEMDGNDSGL